jgi:protease I
VDIVSVKKGTIGGKHGYKIHVDKILREIHPDEYDILILPGGKAPETIRRKEQALDIARHFFQKNKPVSAICHGPQTLISAGLLKDRHATCYKTVAQEMRAAGAVYEDKEVVVDKNLVASRQPSDLPFFMRETMKMLKKQKS